MARTQQQIIQQILDSLFNAHKLQNLSDIMKAINEHHKDRILNFLDILHQKDLTIQRKMKDGSIGFGLHPKGYKAQKDPALLAKFLSASASKTILASQLPPKTDNIKQPEESA